GPELVLGKLFDTIGFNQVPDTLFRHLVIARLCYPVSKLKTADYLFKYQGETIDVERIYRYLDKLYNKQKELVQQISYDHTLKVLDHEIRVVFYDVTTLYFEIEDQDDLRKTGFSKEGRHQNPQILLGLLVSPGGYPLAYEIFEGNQYEYILGARIKNEKEVMKQKILNLTLRNGQCEEIIRDKHTRLIISYSDARAKKDATNRKRGLEKLERAIASGKLSKKNINNRGYNKYLKLEGDIKA
ncbi:MAG: IS1634 family transposase, partial [Balneolales bacterium]